MSVADADDNEEEDLLEVPVHVLDAVQQALQQQDQDQGDQK